MAFPALRSNLRWFDIEENGEDLPDVDAFDGLVLSGSEHGVYDATPGTGPTHILLSVKHRASLFLVYALDIR